MSVQFFGDVDRDAKGDITSAYPAWYQENLIRELGEDIHTLETRIRSMQEGRIMEAQLPSAKQELRRKKERMETILSTKPRLEGKDKDNVNKLRLGLEEEIGRSMFSHSDMHRGTANPHDELDRQKSNCIPLDGEIADGLGIQRGKNGKVGRDVAIRAWKILSRAVGDDPNPERLRMKYQKEY